GASQVLRPSPSNRKPLRVSTSRPLVHPLPSAEGPSSPLSRERRAALRGPTPTYPGRGARPASPRSIQPASSRVSPQEKLELQLAAVGPPRQSTSVGSP